MDHKTEKKDTEKLFFGMVLAQHLLCDVMAPKETGVDGVVFMQITRHCAILQFVLKCHSYLHLHRTPIIAHTSAKNNSGGFTGWRHKHRSRYSHKEPIKVQHVGSFTFIFGTNLKYNFYTGILSKHIWQQEKYTCRKITRENGNVCPSSSVLSGVSNNLNVCTSVSHVSITVHYVNGYYVTVINVLGNHLQ